jgi:hypothetical protein
MGKKVVKNKVENGVKNSSVLNEIIYDSYATVIGKLMKAGKDATNVLNRYNQLLTEHNMK